jgi:NADH-quinone oxidoreductase subunit J
MTPMQLIFIATAVVVVFSASMMMLTHRMIHSALWFVLALLGVAVIFAMLEASFFAVVQVLVYVGAIAILIIFAVMLTRKALEDTGSQINKAWILSLVIVPILFAGILLALRTWGPLNTLTSPLAAEQHDMGTLGLALVNVGGFALPFEVTSILLLAAMIGAVFIAFEQKEEKK